MKLETFDFHACPVRVMLRDDAPWFVAADVCRVLEIANPSDAIKTLDEDERMTLDITEGHSGQRGGARQLAIISESGLYALVFKSRKVEAKAFRKWVTSEVLPAIRQTGRYAVPQTEGQALSVSLLSFVREVGTGWSLERQIEFGQLARRYAKAMGVVFEIVTEPGVGRVFAFPRLLLQHVLATSERTQFLPDSEACDFEKLLTALHRQEGAALYAMDQVREIAHTMGLYPRIFGPGSSVASQRSAFGRLCERFTGRLFPNGLCLQVRGSGMRRRYEIKKSTPELAMPT